MSTEIRVPTLGESVSEATIGRWFKKPGDPVKADEPLLELETDKVTLEVNAPAAGTLGEIIAKDGETVSPGAILGSISAGGAAAAAPAAAPKAAPAAPAPAAAPAAKAEAPTQTSSAGYGNNSEARPAGHDGGTKENGPAVSRLAAESGVNPAQVPGSGRDGRVTKGDMLAAIATGGARRPSRLRPCRCARPPRRTMRPAKSA
jgi:2-oxoglutarate dehydrogenase E2 component (dihydrolipoamide succinyltransferase)